MTDEITFDIPKARKVDITDFKESLGNLIASYVFLPGPVYRLKMVEGMYSLIYAMLLATGRYPKHKTEMENIKHKYQNAVERYSLLDEGWRDTQKLCFDCESELYRLAIVEDLVKLNPSMFVYGGDEVSEKDDDGKEIKR